ncbi:MAG TPA: response regulator [Dehalococcoidia bacterium]|jgi:DNA-binding response OmpR family regulator|nr:response regulator [Dehalococcoidia bacterium]
MKVEVEERTASVLVVDDDRLIRKLIRANLDGNGTRVIEAATGSEGVRILQQAKVDLVLLDIGLPDVDGWSVLASLRASKSLRDIPLLVVSADPPDRKLMERFGLSDYIQKPFDVRDLVLRVKHLIEVRPSN